MGKTSLVFVLAALLATTPAEGGGVCNVFKHGRVSITVDGFSDACCEATSDIGDFVSKHLALGEQCDNTPSDPKCTQAEAEGMQKGMKAMAACCNPDDKKVLATLIPEEAAMDPHVDQEIDAMCQMGPPPSAQLIAMVAGKLAGVRTEGVTASSWPVIAAVAGLAGGVAGVLMTLKLKLRRHGAVNEEPLIA